MSTNVYYEAEPLLDIVRRRYPDLFINQASPHNHMQPAKDAMPPLRAQDILNIPRATWENIKGGRRLTYRTAETVAHALGMHIANIWTDFYERPWKGNRSSRGTA